MKADLFSWNALILKHAENGKVAQAIDYLSAFVSRGCIPSTKILLACLKACTVGQSVKQLHQLASRCGCDSEIYVQATLVDMYAKCGLMEDAHAVFDGVTHRNVVFWTALISGYAENGKGTMTLEMFSRLKREGCAPNARTFVATLKACLDVVEIKSGKVLHLLACRTGVDSDTYVQGTLVAMYAKFADMEESQKVFDQIQHPDVVSYGALMMGYVENREAAMALELFWRMRTEGCLQDARIFVAALKAFSSLPGRSNTALGSHLHYLAARDGCVLDPYVQTSLVDMYAKCGNMSCARSIFENIQQPTVSSWTALIFGYGEHGEGELAVELFTRMTMGGVVPDARTFVAALKGCCDILEREVTSKKGRVINLLASIHGCDSDIHVQCSLVDMYAKSGDMGYARKIFDDIKLPSLVAWNTLLLGYAENDDGATALELLSTVIERHAPDAKTFVAIVKAAKDLNTGRSLHLLASRTGNDAITYLQASLLDLYAKCGIMEDAFKVFNEIIRPGLDCFNALISGYTDNGQSDNAFNLLTFMHGICVAPDARTFIALLKACGNLGEQEDETERSGSEKGEQLHLLASRSGFDSDMYVQCALIDMYANCNNLESARKVFDSIENPDVVSYSAIMFGYANNGEGAKALDLLSTMKSQKCLPNARTFVAALKACSLLGALEFGKALHAEICHRGYHEEGILANCLVDFYAKCGNVSVAENLFNSHSTKSLITWNALMGGYKCRGDSRAVFDIFNRMCASGLHPNDITFMCLLTTCSHAGLVEKGKAYFEIMCSKYKITPSVDHYTCMLDILSRANKLEDAMVFLRRMPFTPEFVIWIAILGACVKWKHLQLGRLAFDSSVSLDDTNPAAYVLMGNLSSVETNEYG